MTDTMLFGVLKMPFEMAMKDEISRLQYYARVQELVGRFEAQQQAEPVLQEIEQYRMQMAGISTAAIGYWKEGDGILPDYDTLALRDVAKLYAKYDELYKAQPEQQAEPVPDVLGHIGFQEWWDAIADDYEVNDFKKMRRAWNAAVKYEATPQKQAEPVQEPVARVIDNGTPEGATEWIPFTNRVEPLETGDLLYTTPPQRKPLTDHEIGQAWSVADGEHNASAPVKRRITRAIEAAHNIKEEA